MNEHVNLNSPQQLAIFLQERGFALKKQTGRGHLSTDREALEALLKDDDSGLIAEILEYRTLSKLKSTYTDALQEQLNPATERVHATFNQVRTSTGRLSSHDPNLQNIPIKDPDYGLAIRACFQGQGQNILICADYSQIELRLLAHYTQDPILLEAFAAGQDIHARTASEIFEVSLEEVTSAQRRQGKTLNFALLYQQGPQATAKQLGIAYKEAVSFIEKYFKAFATIQPFVERTLEDARQQGYVETLWGRRRYFRNLGSTNAQLRKADERAAFNAPLQGSAADLIKVAMLRVNRAIQTAQLNAKIVLQIHDELIIEAGESDQKQIEQILHSEMQPDIGLHVPIEIEINSGPSWGKD